MEAQEKTANPLPPDSEHLPPGGGHASPTDMSVLHMFLWLREDNRVLREENRAMREENNQRHEENMKRFHQHDRLFWGLYAFIAVFFVSGPGADGLIGQLLLSLFGAR